MATHSYASEYPPGLQFDPDFKKFFEDFYAVSDTPDVHDEYVKNFTDGATLIMASRKAVGKEEILQLRKGLWERVSIRRHFPLKIFPAGNNADEVMLHGTVGYVLKEGGEADIDWAARAHLVKEDGRVKMDFYQVYLDTGAQQKK
ncbi:hypothetical protein BKA81DRAFT_353612 [Phyllosticta paracitricarpa]|uniref:Fungal specific transcription factor n=1 Tax=Phyllosticta paracitricarpa TaxID=2016321 RepID=A0ABR1NJV1_9PEZI